MNKLLPAAFLALLSSSCSHAATDKNNQQPLPASQAKNVIMIVADGMGPAYTTAYRYFNDNPATKKIEQTVFDRHLMGSSSTYPAPISGYITDSAAAATALAAGVKTYNGAIGVDVNKNKVESVLHRAKKQGKKTGVVVTSQINHATPAAYISHNESRRNYQELANSYIDNGINTDVLLGGGWKYYANDKRNLVNEYKQANVHYVDNYQSLESLPKNKAVLGLFADVGLPWALDDTDKFRLSTMTKAAIKQLENEQGFFMLIEASQVDWAGHGRDIAAAMHEMSDLAKTVEYLEQYVANHPDTLVILTADHSTGGLSIGRKTVKPTQELNSTYFWQPEILRTMGMSPSAFSKLFANNEIVLKVASQHLNFELSKTEFQLLVDAKIAGKNLLKEFLEKPLAEQKKVKYKPQANTPIHIALKKIIDVRTNTGWGTISHSASHTAVDVPVFAFGAEKQRFSGAIDNTDIAKKIFAILGK